jgi:hypothetical protein
VIQMRPIPFQNGLPRDSWWYWFKCKNLELNICLTKGLEMNKAQGLIANSCNLFYQNLTSLYTQHQYKLDHIWNYDETRIQARKQLRVRVISKKGSHQVHNIILKSRKWLTMNYAMNTTGGSIRLRFYIFRSENQR